MKLLKTKHEVLRDARDRVKFKRFREGGYDHYNLAVWVDESDVVLDQIEWVEYRLHKSFKRRTRRAESRSNRFSITIWTWGQFDIEVTAHLRDGSVRQAVHTLEYSLPADTGDNYVDVGR